MKSAAVRALERPSRADFSVESVELDTSIAIAEDGRVDRVRAEDRTEIGSVGIMPEHL
jgi:hypothetical protein